MKIIVPMAGRGSRFADQGLSMPKPLIQVYGRPMVAWALESLQQLDYSQLVFIALQEHERAFGVTAVLRQLAGPSAQVIVIPNVTEGQLCTVLAAKELIDTDEDILIASADTFIRSSLGQDVAERSPACRGLISVASMSGERWSFARTDAQGNVVEVAEKVRISDHASTGLYYFSSGSEFVQVAETIIANQEKTRGEYYVIPVYQKYIERGWQVRISIASEMWDMGTPEALQAFKVFLEKTGFTSE
jgi:dTDP-glucose pyrophosphorylase